MKQTNQNEQKTTIHINKELNLNLTYIEYKELPTIKREVEEKGFYSNYKTLVLEAY